VNTLTSPAPVTSDAQRVEELIARVLGRAHRAMEALDAPHDARTILQIAQSFADELTTLDAGFDRMQFIRAITEDAS
jgi:hypothetical protein